MADVPEGFTGRLIGSYYFMNDFYTYAYLRESGTPYYIGKGRGQRAYSAYRSVPKPPVERILILKQNLTEEEAFKHEIYMIAVFGRKDTGTGILYNFTDGGEGCSGRICGEETRNKLREANSGEKSPMYGKPGTFTGKEHTPEAKEKMRQKKLGKKLSDETKEKMRKPKIQKKKRNCKPRGPMSEETKRKISETKRKKAEERKKPVYQDPHGV
jgi:hypothetical protein